MSYLFGPCAITHGATDLGKTLAGGNITIVSSHRVVETFGEAVCVPEAKYGTGIIKAVELVAGTVNADLTMIDFASLVLTGKDFTITMPAAKLLWPTSLSFGANSQDAFNLDFFFRPLDSFGDELITFAVS